MKYNNTLFLLHYIKDNIPRRFGGISKKKYYNSSQIMQRKKYTLFLINIVGSPFIKDYERFVRGKQVDDRE